LRAAAVRYVSVPTASRRPIARTATDTVRRTA
jgi:hypothetical protein